MRINAPESRGASGETPLANFVGSMGTIQTLLREESSRIYRPPPYQALTKHNPDEVMLSNLASTLLLPLLLKRHIVVLSF